MSNRSFIFENQKSILLFFFTMIFISIALLSRIEILMYPKMSKPRIIMTIYRQGFSTSSFYQEFDYVEEKLKNIEDVISVEGNHNSRFSRYDVYFDWNLSSEEALARVNVVLDEVKNDLPSEYENSISANYYAGDSGLILASVTGEGHNVNEIYKNLKTYLENDLNSIPGVKSLKIQRPERLLPDVRISPYKAMYYGITTSDIQRALGNVGIRSMGSIRDATGQTVVEVRNQIESQEDLRNLLIKTIQGTEIRLKDIANINISYTYPREIYQVNGKGAIIIIAESQPEANIRLFSETVKKIINEKHDTIPALQDYTFDFVLDPSDFINNSVKSVVYSAITGAVLSILIVFLILGEVKNTIIIGVSIPLSIIYSFILMYFFKVTINLISLGGMTLSVGMVIDASIVSMENIHRHIIEDKNKSDLQNLIAKAIAQVRESIIYSTLTSVVVFLPISFTSPLTNAILGEQAKTIIFALTSSVLVSLVFVPLLSYLIYKNKKVYESKNASEKVMNVIINGYGNVLSFVLRSKVVSFSILAIVFAMLVLSFVFITPLLKKELLGKPSGNNLVITIADNSYTDGMEFFNEVYKPQLEKVMGDIASDDVIITLDQGFTNSGVSIVRLKSAKLVDKYKKLLQNKYTQDGNTTFEFDNWDPSELPLPFMYDYGIMVSGEDKVAKLDILNDIATYITRIEIEDMVRQPDGSMKKQPVKIVRGAYPYPNSGEFITVASLKKRSEITLPNESSIEAMIRRNLFANIQEIDVKFLEDDEDTLMIYYGDPLTDVKDLQKILVPYQDTFIPLSHVYDVKLERTRDVIFTHDGIETYKILGYIRGENEETIDRYTKILKEKMKDYKVQDGYAFEFIDTKKEIQDNISSLLTALITSIIIIYLILTFQFKSYLIPLIILLTVPLGFIGVLLSLFIFKSTISLNSMLGSILLGGIVVNNAIMMIDFFLQLKTEGVDYFTAIVSSAKLRISPILMTTLTTFTGMFPIALALGDGANVIQPLGIAVTGGLVFSTFLTLFVIPITLNLKESLSTNKKVISIDIVKIDSQKRKDTSGFESSLTIKKSDKKE